MDQDAVPVYDERRAAVKTKFESMTNAYEPSEPGTLFALYPHQWLHTRTKLLDK